MIYQPLCYKDKMEYWNHTRYQKVWYLPENYSVTSEKAQMLNTNYFAIPDHDFAACTGYE